MKTAWLAGLIGLGIATAVGAADWASVESKAKGQTVYFNAWGGGESINQYIDWAAQQTQERYGVTLKHVKITDAAEVVKRIKTELDAGRSTDGTVDLMWVNGENFKALKQANALYGNWVEALPNWQYVDLTKPVRQDFSESTDNLEAPWGMAQLTFIADKAKVAEPPRSAAELLAFAKTNPGRVTYPKPPAFHGTTFLKQLLTELTPDPAVLQQPVDSAQWAAHTQPLWDYLDELHPVTWREGKNFPATQADMIPLLADGELLLALTFNPNEAANLIESGQLPDTAYSFGFTKGTIGNVHFLAIPANAKAKEGAQVVANFLLSPEAQARKADVKIWGDPTVVDVTKLTTEQQATMNNKAKGALAETVPTLPEPHASWVEALETEWLKRYGSQ
ncbi:MAG: ABC transporter substrate-binding protein [Thiofilum sp.]|uniref:ABC transporter substrate-binding protein n=1 Tax=Thiofilum sp. TaxID=2212733 RepID=UPI0025F59B65|nr:ABC transporter substrate-binding protein [Thiofilum sp.]MBK8454692.1 ABC transporter substrate-binding protein [Thiofilum sp.]